MYVNCYWIFIQAARKEWTDWVEKKEGEKSNHCYGLVVVVAKFGLCNVVK